MATAKIPAKTDRSLAKLQLEGVPADETPKVDKAEVTEKNGDYFVHLNGKQFKLSETIGIMAALKFNSMASADDDEDVDLETLYLLLYSLLYDEGEFKKFERHAILSRADGDDLAAVIAGSMEAISGRPTEEQSGS